MSAPTKSLDTMLAHLPAGAFVYFTRLPDGRFEVSAYAPGGQWCVSAEDTTPMRAMREAFYPMCATMAAWLKQP